MIRILYILLYINAIIAYPIGIGPDKFNGGSNYNKNNICYLNYNNAYSSFIIGKKIVMIYITRKY